MIAKGGVEDTTFEAKDTKKYEVKDRLLENRPFRGQKKNAWGHGHGPTIQGASVLKKNNNKVAKKFSRRSQKKKSLCRFSARFLPFSKVK